MQKLNNKGIGSQIHYIPLHRHFYIKKYYNSSIIGKYRGSEDYYSKDNYITSSFKAILRRYRFNF